MRKEILFLFLFLLVIPSFVSAVQIDGTLTVIYPKDNYYSFNDTFYMHFNALESNFDALHNTDYTCGMFIFNTQNEKVLENLSGSNDVDTYSKAFFVNLSVTGVMGSKYYLVWCNSTEGEYGYVSEYFEITTDSEAKDESSGNFLAVIALIPLIFGIMLIFALFGLGSEHTALKWFLFMLSPITVWISLHWAMIGIVKYLGMTELQEAIGVTVYWSAWIYFVMISYLVIYLIWKLFDYMAQKKEAKLEY